MTIEAWMVVFHPPKLWLRAFGHVEVFGVTKDDVWVFLNPTWGGSEVFVPKDAEEAQLAIEVTTRDALVLRIDQSGQTLSPILPLQTCATICGHIVGYRAFTPWGLRRKLLKNGAKVVYDGRPQRKQGKQDPAGAGTHDRGCGSA